MGAAERVTASSLGRRRAWGVAAVVVAAALLVWALAGFVERPHVDSGVMLLIALSFFVMCAVLAWEGAQQAIVTLDDTGYRSAQGGGQRWDDVLAIGTGQVDGRAVPVVAHRASNELGVAEETFPAFADEDAPHLVAALRTRVATPGFGQVTVPPGWWDGVETEANRVEQAVAQASGRTPLLRERVAFGYPGLATAIRLDYGINDAGERVELFCRQASDLALTTADGRRWLRQNRKRSADPATQVGWLFGPHTATVIPSAGATFDRLVVECGEHGRLVFNAEEPDRF